MTAPASPSKRWYAICLRLDVTGTSNYEEPAYSAGAAALNSRLRKQ